MIRGWKLTLTPDAQAVLGTLGDVVEESLSERAWIPREGVQVVKTGWSILDPSHQTEDYLITTPDGGRIQVVLERIDGLPDRIRLVW